jgi:choline dehydrogenase-like flavoprotein
MVQGIDGLRIVDGSIFPEIPRAGMFIPVMMAA